MHIDLNTISKQDFANELLIQEAFSEFYNKHEGEILTLSFDFEKLKEEFEDWLCAKCEL